MSTPPPQTTHQTQKRPLEEHSSDSGPGDQPEAKRPALDTIKNDLENGTSDDKKANPAPVTEDAETTNTTAADEVMTDGTKPIENGVKSKPSDEASDVVPSVPPPSAVLETQPIQSTTSASGHATSHSQYSPSVQDESGWLHVRSIISSAEAATVIGKGGENVTVIRRMAGAKCTVSDYTRGAVERILTVSGQVDAVAKAFGLIIRTLNNEDLETSSTAQSKTYPLRLLIPHILIGSIIGQKGVRIREIQEASGARLNASDNCLPLSTERSLVVLGVADAVHIATYYVGSTLVEQLTEKFGGPAASAYASRSGGPVGAVLGGMQVVPYTPQNVGGNWGSVDSMRRHPPTQASRAPANVYGVPYTSYMQQPQQQQSAAGMQFNTNSPRPGGYQSGGAAQGGHGYHGSYGQNPQGNTQTPQQSTSGGVGQPITQQIYIPNDMVGAIIGKGGAKINEIRQLSNSVIKINEPQDNSNERLVTITGTQECNQMALYMLYQRLESEKHRI